MKNITKELLQQTYSQTNKSGLQIARELKISRTQLGRLLDKFGIRHKTLSEIMIGRKLNKEHKSKVIKTLIYGTRGSENHNWKGGKIRKKEYKSNKSYIYLRFPEHPHAMSNGYFAEHRYIMEQKLGRYLSKNEHIHHINGIKDDNRIENLELVNGHTHNLITMMESRIKTLENENKELKKRLGIV